MLKGESGNMWEGLWTLWNGVALTLLCMTLVNVCNMPVGM